MEYTRLRVDVKPETGRVLGPVTLTGDHIIFFFAWFDGLQPPNAAPVEKAFLASGVFPPDTVFCCP